MSTYGTPGTATYSVTFNSLDAMLASVLDNNRQLIGSTAVRNSLFTLWELFYTNVGATGPAGPSGPAGGPQGFQGFMGSQGFQGIVGLQGWQGSGITGSQGLQGLQGRQGFQGLQGTQGLQGVQGNIGGTGIQGFQGFQGFQGSGTTGSQGFQGRQGFQGFQGFQGWQGSGTTGSQGNQGWQGTTTNGVTGSQGPQGLAGTSGATSGIITGYGIKIHITNGLPDTILGASSSDGTIIYNGSTWISGWSSDPIGNSGNNYLIKIYHPLGRILNMTTHGLNSGNVYSIAVYGKSTGGTTYCTLVQPSDFSYFSLYGTTYLATGCAQTGTTEVVITFQAAQI